MSETTVQADDIHPIVKHNDEIAMGVPHEILEDGKFYAVESSEFIDEIEEELHDRILEKDAGKTRIKFLRMK